LRLSCPLILNLQAEAAKPDVEPEAANIANEFQQKLIE
jgi:hypothetical protein